ncbi:hypothetical protein Tco_0006745 [Tanacetum coccineum]
MDQLEKQIDNENFQEIGSMAAFKVLETQFQMFIKSQIYLDDEYVVMTRNYFLQYTQLEIPEFRDTLIKHMKSMQTTEEKVDTSKALDASLVDTESSRTESKEQDTKSRSGNDAHADDADIRLIYDEEPMAEGLRFGFAFCLKLKTLVAFWWKESLAKKFLHCVLSKLLRCVLSIWLQDPHCVLLQDFHCVLLQVALTAFLLQDLIAFCFKLSLRFASTSLRFAQDLHCVLLEDHIAF